MNVLGQEIVVDRVALSKNCFFPVITRLFEDYWFVQLVD